MIHHSFLRIGTTVFRPCVLAGLIMALGVPSAEAQTTLRGAAERALAANRGLRGAQRTVQAESAGLRAARGRLLPEISVNAAYTYLDDEMVLDLNPVREAMISLDAGDRTALKNLESLLTRGRPLTDAEQAAYSQEVLGRLEAGVPPFTEVLKDQGYLKGAVTVRQPLFTGGKISAGIRAARAKENGAEAGLDAQRAAVLAEAAQRYLDVLLATENLRVREEARATLVRHRDRAARLMAEGVIANHEKMRADVGLADAERAELTARKHLRIAQAALASVMGTDSIDLAITDTLRFAASPFPLDETLQALDAENPTLRQLQAGTEALRQKSQARKADFFPTVYGFGMYNIFDEYRIEGVEPRWAVGIGASFTLFDGARRSREWEQARLEASALEERAGEARRKLRLALQSATMQMDLAEEQYRLLGPALDQARENLRLNSRRFDEGLGTSLEVIDARLSLDAVLLQRASALHSLYSKEVEVSLLVGGMDDFLRHWDTLQQHD